MSSSGNEHLLRLTNSIEFDLLQIHTMNRKELSEEIRMFNLTQPHHQRILRNQSRQAMYAELVQKIEDIIGTRDVGSEDNDLLDDVLESFLVLTIVDEASITLTLSIILILISLLTCIDC